MNMFKKTMLSVAVAATTFTAIPAEAGERWREHHRNRDSDGDLVAAGIVGLALGALAVGAIASNRDEPVSRNPLRHPRPRPDRYVDAEPSYVIADDAYGDYEPSFEPWSRSWYRYCRQRYQTFDAATGTYVGYDGREHFCRAN